MKILHTSDWHLGRDIHGYDLGPDQVNAINFIADEAIARKVDVVLIAGDVYDLARPAGDDITRLRQVLKRFHDADIHVILTAGNHDSGERLGAYGGLLADKLHVFGMVEDAGTAVEIHDEHGPVLFYPLTFLDPNEARFVLAEDQAEPLARSHEAVMAEAMRRVRADIASRFGSARSVVVAHAFVTKGGESDEELKSEQCESERDIAVGGVPTIPSSVFAGTNYVALGHLHGPRNVVIGTDGPTIRYSGSILRYSLSEAKHSKSFSIIDLPADGNVTDAHIEVVDIPQPCGMARLTDSLDELLSSKYDQHHNDFVELNVTDMFPEPNYYAKLEYKFKRILTHSTGRPDFVRHGDEDLGPITERDPMELMKSFYKQSTSDEMSDKMTEILRNAYEQALKQVTK